MCLNLQIPFKDVENSLSAQGMHLLPGSLSSSSWDPFPVVPEQRKHYPKCLNARKNSVQAPVPGGWLLRSEQRCRCRGTCDFCIAPKNTGKFGRDVPTAGCQKSPGASPAFPPLGWEGLGCRDQPGDHPTGLVPQDVANGHSDAQDPLPPPWPRCSVLAMKGVMQIWGAKGGLSVPQGTKGPSYLAPIEALGVLRDPNRSHRSWRAKKG